MAWRSNRSRACPWLRRPFCSDRTVSSAAGGLEHHLVAGLHHHLLAFRDGLAVDQEAAGRAVLAAVEALRPAVKAAGNRIQQPRLLGPHAEADHLAAAAR